LREVDEELVDETAWVEGGTL